MDDDGGGDGDGDDDDNGNDVSCRRLVRIRHVNDFDLQCLGSSRRLTSVNAFHGLQVVVLPPTIHAIGPCVFKYCSWLHKIIIPDTVTSIGWGAFRDCTHLTSVALPDSIMSIDVAAFANCSRLTSLIFPPHVTAIADRLCCGCTRLADVILSDACVRIGAKGFADCRSLSTIDLPSQVEEIENNAFAGCTKLLFIVLPRAIESISDYCFFNCVNLASVRVKTDNLASIGKYSFAGTAIGDVSARSIITDACASSSELTIGVGAFSRCVRLTCLHFPSCVAVIPSMGFQHCASLTSLDFAGDDSSGVVDLRAIDSCAFQETGLLGILRFPDTVAKIGSCAFQGCTGIRVVHLPDNLTSLGDEAFQGCALLSSMLSGRASKLQMIGGGCFDSTNLKRLVLPRAMKCVGHGAFASCHNLHTVRLPDTIQLIGWRGFGGCTALRSVIFANDRCSRLLQLLLPAGAPRARSSSSSSRSRHDAMGLHHICLSVATFLAKRPAGLQIAEDAFPAAMLGRHDGGVDDEQQKKRKQHPPSGREIAFPSHAELVRKFSPHSVLNHQQL